MKIKKKKKRRRNRLSEEKKKQINPNIKKVYFIYFQEICLLCDIKRMDSINHTQIIDCIINHRKKKMVKQKKARIR